MECPLLGDSSATAQCQEPQTPGLSWTKRSPLGEERSLEGRLRDSDTVTGSGSRTVTDWVLPNEWFIHTKPKS